MSFSITALAFLLYCLARSTYAVQESHGEVAPYILVVVSKEIRLLHMNGTISRTLCTETQYIEAIDYHYNMQHAYFTLTTGEIRRVRLDVTQNASEAVVFPLFASKDLAVDWIEDMLYWTSGQIDTRIYKLDITTIGLNTPQIVEIPVNIETATFTYIVLNPINRTIYVVEVWSDTIKEIDYRGETVRNISPESFRVSCPALSFFHAAIFWVQTAADIVVQGLINVEFSRQYTPSGGQLYTEIIYFRGNIYWSQKAPMGIYYRWWNESDSDVVTVREFPSTESVNDMILVHPSKQPYSADEIAKDELTRPPTSEDRNTHYTDSLTRTTTRQYHTTTNTRQLITEHGSAMVASSQSKHSVVTSVWAGSTMISTTTTVATVTHLLTTLHLESGSTLTTSSSRSHEPSAISRPTQNTPQPTVTPLSSQSVITVETRPHKSAVSMLLTTTPMPQPSTPLSELVTLVKSIPPTTLLPSQTSSLATSFFLTPVSVTSVHIPPRTTSLPTQRTSLVIPLSQMPQSVTPVNNLPQTTLPSAQSGHSSSSTVTLSLATTHEMGRVSASVSNLPQPMQHLGTAPAPPHGLAGSQHNTGVLPTSTVFTQAAQWSASETLSTDEHIIQPSLVVRAGISTNVMAPIMPGNSDREKTSTLEAVAITSACIGVAVLIFVGLAISDAIYYFSYERKLEKNTSSGVLGVLWRIATLPCQCLLGPRYTLRKRRRPQHPYVPRCMNGSDISMYYTNPTQTATTTPSTDHSGTPNSYSGTSNGHSGASNNTTADISILSGNDGNGDFDSLSGQEDAATTTIGCGDAHYDEDYRGDTPSEDVTQLELEIKAVLGVLELESELVKISIQ